jgi:hypothetical protein
MLWIFIAYTGCGLYEVGIRESHVSENDRMLRVIFEIKVVEC